MDILLSGLSGKPGATPLLFVSGKTPTGYRLMDAQWGLPSFTRSYSGMRGTQGARLAGREAENVVSSLVFQIVGEDQDELHERFSALATFVDECSRFGGTLTRRDQGASFTVYPQILDALISEPQFGRLYHKNHRLTVTVQFVTPPYVNGAPMDVSDDFSTDLLDYSFDLGSGTLSVSGGQLVPSSTAEKRLYHSATGYTYSDVQVTLKYVPGSVTTLETGVTLRRLDADNWLFARATADALQIFKVDAAAFSLLANVAITTLVNGTPYWIRFRGEGNVLYAEHFIAEPTPMGTPATSLTYTLAGADATKFGVGISGQAGIRVIPGDTAIRYDDFRVEPYTYRNLTLPDVIQLRGAIPGDASALCEAHITHSGGAAAPIWALLAWWERPLTYNQVWNGDFDLLTLATNGWSVAAVTNISGAASSITRVTTVAKYGLGSGEIVCPATADTGANFRIFRRFKKGVTYTAEAWIQSAAGVTNTYIRLGNGAANDKASSGNTALSASWQRITVTWTPSADRDDAHVAINIAAATGTTFRVDGVMVYEGTVAPTGANQLYGRGAYPPIGIIEAESSGSPYIAADANYRSGWGVTGQAPSGGSQGRAVSILIDPSLLVPDGYTQDEVSLEVWGRVEMQSTITAFLSLLYADPITSTGGLGARQYSAEYGSAQKSIVRPSTGQRFRFVRLGTLRLPTNLGGFILGVAVTAFASGGTGNYGLDCLGIAPSGARALGPTGKAWGAESYPAFIGNTTEVTKRVQADLTGALREPALGTPEVLAHGLGGSLLELPPGDVDFALKLSSLVPDDPTSDATTEQLAHSGTVHLGLTPRWTLARS